MLTSDLNRYRPALLFIALQWTLFALVVALGWWALGHPPPGEVDWVVTGAYGGLAASVPVLAAWRHNRPLACCGGAFFCLGWAVSAYIVARQPGFIAHAPVVYGACAAMCAYHGRYWLTALVGTLALVTLSELLLFGPVWSGGGVLSTVAVVIHQSIFVAWTALATADIVRSPPQSGPDTHDAAETLDSPESVEINEAA